jgi:hypothetical protein
MLVRAGQLGAKVEATEGVEETLAAADFAGNTVSDDENPLNSAKYSQYERNLRYASLSKGQNLPGSRLISFKFSQEAVGGAAATAAPWHKWVRGCGFSVAGLKKLPVSTVTGTWRVGDIFGNNAVQGSATATGRFVYRQTLAGTVTFAYLPLTGTIDDTMTLTNYSRTGGAVSDLADPSDGGFAFAFQTETDAAVPPSLTVEERLGGLRFSGIGCRGMGGLIIERDKPLLMPFEFQGAQVFDPSDPDSLRTGSALTGVPQHLVQPSVAKGITLNFYEGSTTYSPVLIKMEIKFGNVLAPRPTVGASLANSGYLGVRISDRKPTANVDPEFVAPGTFNYVKKFVSGTTFEMESRIGDALNANGLVIAHAPRMQLTGDLQFGNRDGLATIANEAMLAGSADDELYLYHVYLA